MVTTCTAFDKSRLTTFNSQDMAKDVGPTASALETMLCGPSPSEPLASDVNMIITIVNNVSVFLSIFVDLNTKFDYPPSYEKPSN